MIKGWSSSKLLMRRIFPYLPQDACARRPPCCCSATTASCTGCPCPRGALRGFSRANLSGSMSRGRKYMLLKSLRNLAWLLLGAKDSLNWHIWANLPRGPISKCTVWPNVNTFSLMKSPIAQGSNWYVSSTLWRNHQAQNCYLFWQNATNYFSFVLEALINFSCILLSRWGNLACNP